jgi:very-short-patch-repair endonuclease
MSPRVHGTAAEPPDLERVALVDRAREEWVARLIDVGRRNNLLYFRALKLGTLEFTDADPDDLAALLRGEPVPVMELVGGERSERVDEESGHLLADGDELLIEDLRTRELEQRVAFRLREIRRKAVENMEEKGLDTLYLAIGMATWPVEDGGRPPSSPVILIPVTIQTRGTQERAHTLRRTGDVVVNPVLLHVLEASFGVRLASEDLLAGVTGVEEDTEEFHPDPVFDRIRAAAGPVRGFAVERRVVLGNFSFAKMAMVKDLQQNAEVLHRHDLIAAVAGHAGAREAIRPQGEDPDPPTFDHRPPHSEHLILDADSSQQKVVAEVCMGRHGVIQGPPGTGKSQTISNLIAELAARRSKVLFVAEKRAALEVVLRRLEREGLGHLVLDLHGAGISRKEIMARVRAALEAVKRAPEADGQECHRDLLKNRERLNAHVRRIHMPRPPSVLSVHRMQGEMLRTPEAARLASRWRGTALEQVDSAAAERVEELLEEVAGLEHLFLRDDPSPWTGAELGDSAKVREALDLAADLAGGEWSAFRHEMDRALVSTGLPIPATLADARACAALISDIMRTARRYGADFHARDLDGLAQALAPAKRGTLARLWAFVSNGRYREARASLRSRRAEGPAAASVLVREIEEARGERKRWDALGGGSSVRGSANSNAFVTSAATVSACLARLEPLLARGPLEVMSVEDLGALVNGLAADTITPHLIPRLRELEAALLARGVGNLVRELRERRLAAEFWRPAFRYAWFASCVERAWGEDHDLPAFNGRTHDGYVEHFKERDVERLKVAAARVRRLHAERVIAVMNAHPEQEAVVRAEAGKKTRHMPLRRLLEQAPDVLTALFPCWMASPLSVSQLLAGDRRYFDVALFDEASQVPPEDAIPSIMRADRLVVAGDRHQLPPTAFFADGGPATDDAGDCSGVTEGFESLLDAMDAFLPSWMLEWHYRSRDEALIAFSNRHIYHDRLITFPGPGTIPAVSHAHVDQMPGRDGQEDSVGEEVRRVVDLVIRHAEDRPHETLGVIALGIKHARRIQMELDRVLPLRPDLDEFFDQSKDERFFVKNLERVQGDERDSIVLSVGYGKDRAGNLPYRFGPILQNGGERRLNVAVTRARVRMVVVSSFTHHDMDPSRSTAKGVEFLRLYLQYAASGGNLLGYEGASPVPLNGFEADIKDALEARGIPLIPQYGCSKYRIDLVAQHPERPGRLVLAIECDGASYHSSPTARDRDRLRQQMLEGLGWRFHRIWSTDWFLRRDEEIERAVEAYRRAVAHAEALDAGQLTASPEFRRIRQQNEDGVADQDGNGAGPVASENGRRLSRPGIVRRQTITEYSPRELRALIRWIRSDSHLRTDDELIAEAARKLGFRRGSRIVRALMEAIDATR